MLKISPKAPVRFLIQFMSILIICSTATFVQASSTILQLVPNAQKVGQGRFSYLLWDVYDVALYAPQGKVSGRGPFALSLSYLMNLNGKQIADRSAEEIRKLGFRDEVRLATWHSQMRRIFPNVEAGDRITGVLTQAGETVFFKGNREIGRVRDQKFGSAFFGIWLNRKTSDPKLRRKLLGAS